MTTTSYNRFRSAWIRLFVIGVAANTKIGEWLMAKSLFSLVGGINHRTRPGCLRQPYHIKGHPPMKKNTYTTIKWSMGTCGTGGWWWWAGIIYLTHTPHIAWILDLQNWLSGVGDIALQYQKHKTINKRDSIRWGIAWRDRNVSTMEWKCMWTPPPSILALKMEGRRGIQTNSEYYALSEQFFIECNKLDFCLLKHAIIELKNSHNIHYSLSHKCIALI